MVFSFLRSLPHDIQVADNATLYGVCVFVPEMVQRAPAFFAMNADLSPQRRSGRFLVSAPRCYCLLTRLPYFDLHFEVLNRWVSFTHDMFNFLVPLFDGYTTGLLCPNLATRRLYWTSSQISWRLSLSSAPKVNNLGRYIIFVSHYKCVNCVLNHLSMCYLSQQHYCTGATGPYYRMCKGDESCRTSATHGQSGK